jgi:hypothetical protein
VYAIGVHGEKLLKWGFRPHAASPFCFGKRNQNHFRPSAALQRMVKKLPILFQVPPPPPHPKAVMPTEEKKSKDKVKIF